MPLSIQAGISYSTLFQHCKWHLGATILLWSHVLAIVGHSKLVIFALGSI